MTTAPDGTRKPIRYVVALTAVAGIVDAVSFLALARVFTSNMTGNLASVAFAATTSGAAAVAGPGTSLSGFMCGALIGGRALRTARAVTRARTLLIASAACLCTVIGLLAVAGSAPWSERLPVFLLGLAMGLQAVAVRPFGITDVPTVVITSTLVGLLADSRFGSAERVREHRRLGAVCCFVAGATVAGVLCHWSPAVALVPAVVLDAVVVAALRQTPRRDEGSVSAGAIEAAERAARSVAMEYVRAFNADDLAATRAVFHYPSVRLVAGDVRIARRPDDIGIAHHAVASEGWVHTRLDSLATVHAGVDKVHLAARFTRLDAAGNGYATYEALWIVTRDAGRWAIQCRSTFAPAQSYARYE